MESDPMDSDYPVGSNDDLKIREFICKGLDFEEWVSLITEVEKTYYDNIQKISLVYDSFFSEFPLCHGYWRRYADHKIRLCSIGEVVSVFERSVQSATYSVAIWVDYCTFCMSTFENPSDIRRLFKRGLSYVGKDYLCHTLWDNYIKFELSQQQWSSVAHIYVEALRFPTKKLHIYYDSFKKLAALNNKGFGGQSKCSVDSDIGSPGHDEVPKSYGNEEICSVVKDLFDPSISFTRSKTLLQKYISIGEHLYMEASRLDKKVRKFEAIIRRTYFHVKPLSVDQLENWHRYLDFVEMQEDFDWAVKIYERCLIPCANYPEFWMRYVEFMETKGGREIANYAHNRATKVILKRLPVIHLFSARFKEHQGDVGGAHSALLHCDVGSDSEYVDHVVIKANMERRLGNFVTASKIFEEAIELASVTRKWQNLPSLYVQFSRLKHMITDSSEAARDVLIRGIERLPGSKLLLEELINFATMNGGQRHIQALDCVIDTALSPGSDESRGLDDRDAEEVSRLYLKFVDLFGTILEVRKAWNQHIKLFPHTVRTSFSEQPAKSLKSLKLAGTDRETSIITKPRQLSGDSCPDNPVKLPLQCNEFPTGDSRPGNDSPNRTPEQIAPAKESHDTDLVQAPVEEIESGESTHDEQERVASPFTEVPEQSRKDVPETSSPPMDSKSSKVSEPPMEDITECKVAETGTKSEQDSNVQLIGDDMQPEFDHVAPEQDLKSLSLISLSLYPRDDSNPDPNTCTLSQSEAPRETSNIETNLPKKDKGSSVNSQGISKASDSSQTDIELANSSFPTANQGLVSTEPPHQPQIPTNSGIGNWSQTGYSGKVRKETNFGPRGQVQTKPRLQHQVSPQAESVGPTPVQQGFPPRLQVQPGWRAQHPPPANSPPNTWPQQILPQQNFPSLPQATMQGVDNQMWQQYYHLLMQQQQQHYRPLPYRQQYYQQPPPYQQLQMQQQQYNQFYQHPVPQQLHPQPVPEPAAALVMPSQLQDKASTPSAKQPSPPGRQ